MLVYHPIYDVNHCLYRMLLAIDASTHESFEWDVFRLMNFYLLFPHLLKELAPFPLKLRPYRKMIEQIPASYVEIPSPQRALFDLGALQKMAANHMAAKKIINLEKTNSIEPQAHELSQSLINCIKEDPIRQKPWFKVIVDELPLLDLRGKNGLKKRSGLMEYQYDIEGDFL